MYQVHYDHDAFARQSSLQTIGMAMTDRIARRPNEKFVLLAAKSGHAFIISAFLRRPDVDLNLTTGHGQTPLSLAAENGHSEIVEMLLTQDDVDVNMQDLDSQTPLGWAVFNGHTTVVANLVRNPKVRLDIRDVEGRTPLSWAIINRQDLILGLLLNRLGVCCDRRSRKALFKIAKVDQT